VSNRGLHKATISEPSFVCLRALSGVRKAITTKDAKGHEGKAFGLKSYNRLISDATYPAPKPLSIFTTLTLEAQEFIIPSSAATPLNAAP